MQSILIAGLLLLAITSCAVCQNPAGPPENICAGQAVGFLFPDYADCNAFYRCTGGLRFARGNCAPNQRFNAVLRTCVAAAQGSCFSCPAAIEFADRPINVCDQFVRCINGQPARHMQCAPGLLFDQRFGSCNVAAQVGCPPVACPAVDSAAGNVMVRDGRNCGVYFVCIAGRASRQECSPGLHFNPVTQLCVLPADTNCR